MLAAALVPLNSTMIAVALLDVERDLDVGVAAATWLVSGYLVAMAVVQPLGGRVGDAIGHRRGFLAGLGGFLAASALAAAAPTLGALVALRVSQALAGGLMMPNAAALLRDAVPPGRRGRVFGWFGTGMGLAAAVGPVLGGGLVAALGWRAVFLVNLPLGAVALLAGRALPAGAPAPRAAARPAAAGAGALPRSRPYLAATATILLHNMAMYGLLLVVPLIADRRLGLGEGAAGLLVGGMTAAMMLGSPVGGELSDRLGRRAPALAGSVLAAVATLLLALASGRPSTAAVAALLVVAGVGFGLAGASLQTTALEAVPEGSVAMAGGLFMTMRYTGGIAATGVAAAVGAGDAFGAGLAVLAVAAALSLATASGLPAGVARAPAAVPPRA
ncbi:MFS transporter [Miltoncostaea marina]|uniref:MFS transporter n=1 Tax=Miltoncostaea marina TaxID=2843215 RepID=UPI001C3E4B48|nr:MFS transporter [Miltoncostaea marina]